VRRRSRWSIAAVSFSRNRAVPNWTGPNDRIHNLNLRHSWNRSIRLAIVFLFLLLGTWRVPATPNQGSPAGHLNRYEYALPRMGTEFRIVLYHTDSLSAQKAAMAAFDRVEDLEDIFSDYRERSEVNRLCQVAVGKPWNTSPELFFVLETSLAYSRLSGGAFDVTIGPVVQLWRQARKSKHLPDPSELEQARHRIGYSNIVLNPADHTAMLKLAAMKIDFGAIAKGYAADQALELLKSRGITRALVAGGGDIAVGAPPPDSPGWAIEILKPEAGSAGNQGFLTLHDSGVATSGDIFQFVEIDGRHYSHIINPFTGVAVTDAPSATVVALNGMTADAFATTLCVLAPADGLKLIESVPGASAMMVRRSSQGLQRFKSAGFPQITASAEASRTGRKQN